MSDSESGCSEFEYFESENSFSSPLQRVPGHEILQRFSFPEDLTMHTDTDDDTPYLCITIQPEKYFRFRYRSEQDPSKHGYLKGRSTDSSKTCPTVELRNFSGRAVIKCRLYQVDSDEEHPNTLYEEDTDDQEPVAEVESDTGCMVRFQKLGILQTAKKAVAAMLHEKIKNNNYYEHCSKRELQRLSREKAKSINLHKVRLRFSAHNVITDKEICPPVFSEPIFNSKSPTTNKLKICDLSRCTGKASGRDRLILLTDKLEKGKIKVIFFEENVQGERIWESSVPITKANIHHSCALIFNTPPYKDPNTRNDKKVSIELHRITDGSCSEPKPFVYKAEWCKKSRPNPSTEEQNVRIPALKLGHINEMPHTTLTQDVQYSQISEQELKQEDSAGVYQIQHFEVVPVSMDLEPIQNVQSSINQAELCGNPVISQPNVPSPMSMRADNTEQTFNSFKIPYLGDDNDFNNLDWESTLDAFLSADGPLEKVDSVASKDVKEEYLSEDNGINRTNKRTNERRIKKLLKEIFESKRNMISELRKKLERLIEIKQSNGDNFLHIALCYHLPSFKCLVDIMQWVGATRLLDAPNGSQLTVLHLAIIQGLTDVVAYLIRKGCDPWCVDRQGNSALHYAVMCPKSLPTLLNSIKESAKDKLAPFNNEHETPLHWSVQYNRPHSARLLLLSGAPPTVLDGRGRAPLHIAVYNDNVNMVRVLIDFMDKSDINHPDGTALSALQIACADLRGNTSEIVQLLLEKGADPYQNEKDTVPAWRLAKKQFEVWDVMRPYLRADYVYVRSECACSSVSVSTESDSEDEYLSAAEEELAEDVAIKLELESLELCDKEI